MQLYTVMYFESCVHITVKRNAFRNGSIHIERLSSRIGYMIENIMLLCRQDYEELSSEFYEKNMSDFIKGSSYQIELNLNYRMKLVVSIVNYFEGNCWSLWIVFCYFHFWSWQEKGDVECIKSWFNPAVHIASHAACFLVWFFLFCYSV